MSLDQIINKKFDSEKICMNPNDEFDMMSQEYELMSINQIDLEND